MRNPARWRNIGLAGCAIGAAMTAMPFVLPPHMGGDALRAILFSTGITGVLFGGATALWGRQAARAKAALQSGEEVIARWRIDAATWRSFLEADRRARDGQGWLANELSAGDEIPADGVEVVVGRNAIDVGGSVHALPRHGTPEVLSAELSEGRGCPDSIELRLRYPGGPQRGPTDTRLTFPVAPGAWRDARKTVAYYAKGRPGEADFFHGRGDGSDPEDLSTCWSCGYQTHEFRSTCPKCGAGLLSRRWSRRFGSILAVLGFAIAVTMAALLVKLSPMLSHPGAQYGTWRFSGTPAQALMVWGVLSAVFVFGATAAAYGAWAVFTGKRNRAVVYAMVAIFSALCALARWM